jgi:uncharacterized membrane protein
LLKLLYKVHLVVKGKYAFSSSFSGMSWVYYASHFSKKYPVEGGGVGEGRGFGKKGLKKRDEWWVYV